MADEINRAELASIIQRVERLQEEGAALKADEKTIYDQAKEKGLDPKMIKKVIAIRKQDPEKRRIEQADLELYLRAADVE